MSQDQPPNPNPAPQPPEPLPPEPSPSGTPTSALQQAWDQVRPVLKAQTLRALRATIQVLEGAVERLEAEPPPGLPSTTEASGMLATDTPGDALAPKPIDLLGDRVSQAWNWTRSRWGELLGWVRSRLPESLNQQLSDTVLGGAIAAIALVVLWTTSSLVSGGGGKPPVVAVAPSPQPVPPSLTVPGEPVLTPTPVPSPSPVVQPSPVPRVKPSPPPVPTPKPEPVLNLTPEQKLIASIQKQVAEVSNQYGEGLIDSVQVNFKGSRLIVRVNDGWYDLQEGQQDKLAGEVLRRSKILDFSKLEITDTQGGVLARSPVVGSEMVILRRKELSDAEATG